MNQRHIAKRRRELISEWRGYEEVPEKTERTVAVADLLPAILKKLGLNERLDEKKVLAAWADLVGPFISSHAAPDRLRDGVLHVKVLQPALHYELDRVWKNKILKTFQETFGAKTIRSIQFSIR